MKILNKPKCERPDCENEAIGTYNKTWICGSCLIKWDEKIRKVKEKIWIQED